MTRKEEIVNQAVKEQSQLYQSPEWRAGFISGANWADANPYLYEEELVGMGGLGMIWQKKALIKKACEWIEQYLFDLGYPDDWCRDSPNIESGKERFIKAMEL